MKNYFCVNRWVDNNSYSPHPSKEFEPALVQIDDNLNFNVGDQIFLGLDLFKKLHEAAKDFIKRNYGVEVVTFKEIKLILNYIRDPKYLSIMFDTYSEVPSNENYEKYWMEEYNKKYNDLDSTEELEKEMLKLLEEELFDYVIIKVSNVIYDLEKDMRVFELKIEKIDY